MSVALRTKRLNPTTPASSTKTTAVSPPYRPEAEAPERGALEREAPEVRRDGRTESDDHGEGRAHFLEHGFTRGRSRS
jgi:hypothetical protein